VSGNDLNEFMTTTPENSQARMRIVREAFWAIRDCSLPVIGAVQGAALGSGAAIAASCDILVAAEGAKLGLPEVSVGMMGGVKHLSRLVPPNMVRLMFLTGDAVSMEKIEPYGGIAAIVTAEDLMPTAVKVAQRITRHSSVVLRIGKRSLNAVEYMDLKSGYEFEQGLSGELSAYEDAKEAVKSFFENRAPEYVGH